MIDQVNINKLRQKNWDITVVKEKHFIKKNSLAQYIIYRNTSQIGNSDDSKN